MSKFRKKPVVIDAVQLRWDNWNEMCAHADVGNFEEGKPEGCYIGDDGQPITNHGTSDEIGMRIPTLEGVMIARQNDWIIRGVKGELYPCKPEIFDVTYEQVEEVIS